MRPIRRWMEFEDWAEFYLPSQFFQIAEHKYRVLLNFGGPGAATDYYLYARVHSGSVGVITNVSVEGKECAGEFRQVDVPGTPSGFTWVCLGRVKTRRDYADGVFTAPGGLAGLDRLCVVEVLERIESGEIERRIAREALGPEPVSGVPLGGIGTGKLEFCRDGIFRNITINGNIDTPLRRSEASFFAVHARSALGQAGRVLAVEPMGGMVPFDRLTYEGRYPQARLCGSDQHFPLRMEVIASGSIIPRNIEDSCLPLALFRVNVSADKGVAVKARVALCIENILGFGGSVSSDMNRKVFDEGYYFLWDERAGNCESADGESAVRFTCAPKAEKRSEGEYILTVDGIASERLVGWRFESQANPWSEFARSGQFAYENPGTSEGEKTASAIAADIELDAGETRELRFVFAWHVPAFWQSGDSDYGHYHSNRFSSAREIADYGLAGFDRLMRDSNEIPRLLRRSSLPAWFARTLANDAYVLSTCTWFTKDGRFSVNEGPSHMFGCMGTLDQKLYANHYLTLFFPELDRSELLQFVRSQAPDGGIQHDLGYGHLEQKKKAHGWPDLTSSLAILSLKHYQLTGDEEYIDEAYPAVVKGLLEYQLALDSDGDGIANISGVGNTFDAEQFEGTSSYIATVFLAALKSLEELARRRGDEPTAIKARECFDKARASAIEQLWNGHFFVNYYDTSRRLQCPNSHISQIAGEFFAHFCDLGELYGDSYVREAMTSMLRLNYGSDLVFPTNEATPEGKMPYRKLWGWLPHARIYLGGIPLYLGKAEEGLDALKRMDDVLGQVNDDNRWDLRLFYEPDTGREHWGRFYMTAPVTWYIYQALLGWFWDAPAGVLGLRPNLPDKLTPFEGPMFTPAFWAWVSVDPGRRQMTISIIRRFETGIAIRELRLPPSRGVTVLADGVTIPARRVDKSGMGKDTRWSCSLNLDDVEEICIDMY